MTNKECTNCKQIKPLDDYFRYSRRKDGHNSICKVCNRLQLKLSYEKHKEGRLKRGREYYKENRAKVIKRIRKYYKDGRKEHNPDPAKEDARHKLHYAVKTGVIKRLSCSVCDKPNAHAHHEDYTKPLDVMWLCVQHHADRHRYLTALT